MTVRYRNTLSDALYLNAHAYARMWPLWSVLVIFYIGMFHTGYSGMADRSPPFLVRVWVAGFVAFLGLLLTIVGAGLFSAVLVVLISRKDRGFLTEHSITIIDGGLIEETEVNRTETKWTAITRLARTRRHILVFLSPVMAHIIPRHAFADSAECDRFYAELQSRVNKRS